jgi:hypothetical protein
MAERSIKLTKAVPFENIPRINTSLLEVRAGVPCKEIEEHGDLCLHLAEQLLVDLVVNSDEGDLALTARMLVAQARACYQAAGCSS